MACISEAIYELVDLPNNQKISKTFVNKEVKEHKYKGHVPAQLHPWGYIKHLATMQKRKKKKAV